MHAKGIRSPILLAVCALWIGCLPMWIGFKLALGTAFIGTHALFRKSHFSILPTGLMIMLGICMHEYSDWIRPKPHLPLTGLWSCQSQGIQKEGRGFSLLCQCNAYRKPFRVEWPHASPPPFETPFLGSMMPFTHLPPGVIQWKHRRSIFGSLHPTWNQQVSRGPDAVQNHQTHAWPAPPVTAKSELWNDLSRVFSPSVSGLLFALSTGDKQYVVPKTRAALTHAGLAHLLAVSGYHVGLVATIPLFLLRSRRRVFRFCGFISLVGVWNFIAFCEWPISAIRAGIMVTLFAAFQLAYRSVSSLQILALSAWVLLIMRPGIAGELGAQLSFMAVLSILLALQSMPRKNIGMKALALLAVPVAAQWGTGCISWSTFGIFPWYFLLFNLIASPAMVLIGLGLAGWLLLRSGFPSGLSDQWAQHMNSLLEPLVDSLTTSFHAGWSVYVGAVPEWIWWITSGGFILGAVIVNIKPKQWRRALGLNASLLLALTPWIGWYMVDTVEVTYRRSVILTTQLHAPHAVLLDARDSTFFKRQCAQRNVSHLHWEVLEPNAYWSDSLGNWLVRPEPEVVWGKIKNRPIRISRLGGSSISLVFGADRSQMTSWGDPVHFRRNLFNSDEASW